MNILDFIRRNSLLVIIVIFVVGAGLVMMDYSGKASAFSRDFYIQVNGTGYDYAETDTIGANGAHYLSSLFSAAHEMGATPDSNRDGVVSDEEASAFQVWQREHQDVVLFMGRLNEVYAGWHFGPANDGAVNVAINRAILHAEAEQLGIYPTEAQIDAYLRSLPIFQNADGSFNTELYQRLCGYRHGNVNRVQEEAFREVIADVMVWESLAEIVGRGEAFDTASLDRWIKAVTQTVNGRTAWLPASKVAEPPAPTEDEIHAFWEQNKEKYKSEERRIISVYTLSPASDSNMDNLLYTTDALMQELSQANGHGLDKLLEDASQNSEYDPFVYKAEDGSTHRTYQLATQEELGKELSDVVKDGEGETPLVELAFEETSGAPTPTEYEAADKAGAPEKHLSIRQIRGFYTTNDDKLKLLRIEAVEPPEVLPYEQARERAKTDLCKQLKDKALVDAAHKLREEMEAAIPDGGLKGAFEKASEAGAEVEFFGPVRIQSMDTPLPEGLSDTIILSTPSGKLTEPAILPDGARISVVTQRTVPDSPDLTMERRLYIMPRINAQLRNELMREWQIAAWKRFSVQLSQHVKTGTAGTILPSVFN